MEQARLNERLKERDGIKQGSRTDLTSDKLSEVVRQAGVSKRQGTSNTEIISEMALDMTDRQMRNLEPLFYHQVTFRKKLRNVPKLTQMPTP
jgi:hypothetical protein